MPAVIVQSANCALGSRRRAGKGSIPGLCRPARAVAYRNAVIHLTEAFSGGPTFARALEQIRDTLDPCRGVTVPTYRAWADALNEAFRHRLDHLGQLVHMLGQIS